MANSKRKCPYCKEYKVAATMRIINGRAFCDVDHAIKYAFENKDAELKKKQIHEKKLLRARKKEVRPRKQWHDKLQKLVNQYVVYVRDKGKPCYTCGTTNPNIKYDAGHCYTRAARPDIRFELLNIAKQCSVRCNQHGAGMRLEFEQRLEQDHGCHIVDWLKMRKPALNVQYPTVKDIEDEIMLFRFLLRKEGLTPTA